MAHTVGDVLTPTTVMAALNPALAERAARRWLVGTTLSISGSSASLVTLAWVLVTGPGSWLGVGLLAASACTPSILLAGHAGWLADRVSPRRTLAWCESVRAVAAAAAGLAILTGVPWGFLLLYALVEACASALARPSASTALLHSVGPEMLGAAASLDRVAVTLGRIIGPMAGAGAVALAGPAAAMGLNSVSFAATLGLVVPMAARVGKDVGSARAGRPWDTMGSLARDPATAGVWLGMIAVAVVVGQKTAMWPMLAQAGMGASPSGLAQMYTAGGIGGLFALPLAARLTSQRAARGLLWAAAIAAVAMAGATAGHVAAAVLVMAGICDAASGTAYVSVRAVMLAATEPARHGRVLAAHSAVTTGVGVLALAVTGVAAWAGAPATFALGAGVAMLALVATRGGDAKGGRGKLSGRWRETRGPAWPRSRPR